MGRDGSQPNDHKLGHQPHAPSPGGTLYIVSTPIGHPDDITLRALQTLRHVRVVASEDPAITQRLLTHHAITTPITSYGPVNHQEKIQVLLHRLREGHDIAFVSDNGTPVLYDPGCLLVAAAHDARIPITVIPGPSAITAATALSGFSGDAIIFDGHLPTGTQKLTLYLSHLSTEQKTLLFYVPPTNLRELLHVLMKLLPARQIALAINLTTAQEICLRGNAASLLAQIKRVPKKSLVTVVIDRQTACGL